MFYASTMSLMYIMMNNKGPNIDPCGTPVVKFNISEFDSLITNTRCHSAQSFNL